MDVFPQRGEIWQVTFEPAIGAEITKIRPALVVNIPEAGRLPLRIVVPISDWKPIFTRLFWFIHLPESSKNGLRKDSGADCFQVKSLSIQRFVRKVGRVTDECLDDVAAAIALCVGYGAWRS
jgi:mRNA interferase MazF